MRPFIRLSDKILLIIAAFTTVLFLASKFIIGGSIEQILAFGCLVYAIAFIATYAVSRNFSKRIIKLAFKMEEMAAGNFSKKIENKDKDEIGQLTNALNHLLGSLKTGVAVEVSKHKELSRAKSDFVSIAAHQLRTPLSIIKWYIDFLISGDAGDTNDLQKKYLGQVYKSNERLIDLVNALLDVSRIDLGTFAIEPERADIIERAESALRDFLPEIKTKKIELIKEYHKLSMLNLDPRLTKLVFSNLISNAVKYTPEKGVIKILIKPTKNDVFVEISDSGYGIPQDQQPKIFTKLFRADNVKQIESIGTGLGLYIVKAVIEKSGGKIWFESPNMDFFLQKEQKNGKYLSTNKNRGTSFFFTIPLKGMPAKRGTKKLSSLK